MVDTNTQVSVQEESEGREKVLGWAPKNQTAYSTQ